MISKTFKKILIDEKYYKYFENVHFTPQEIKNFNEFNKTFEKYIKKYN